VIAVFNKIGVKVDLFSMVFGESVLNDAVSSE
jgi:sodium/hydrogen exchanger 8